MGQSIKLGKFCIRNPTQFSRTFGAKTSLTVVYDQYGFTRGRSTVTQLLDIIREWMLELNKGNSVDEIYLDLKKAFDTVYALLVS